MIHLKIALFSSFGVMMNQRIFQFLPSSTSIFFVLILSILFQFNTACTKIPEDEPLVAMPGNELDLQEKFTTCVNSQVKTCFDAFLFSEDQFKALIQHEKIDELWQAYQKMSEDFKNQAPQTIDQFYKKEKYQVIQAMTVKAGHGKSLNYGDEDLMLSMPSRPTLMTLRLKKDGEDREGFRINAWVFHEQQWKTFLKIGLFIEKLAKPQGEK